MPEKSAWDYISNCGSVRLASANPDDAPVVDHQLLDHPEDVAELTEACRRIRTIFASAPFDQYRIAERLPGDHVQTDEQWAEYLRSAAFLGYHGVGTCGMGNSDRHVVDENLLVRGLDGLRIVDASVMPNLISGNTNATVLMIAERASDLIATS